MKVILNPLEFPLESDDFQVILINKMSLMALPFRKQSCSVLSAPAVPKLLQRPNH